jgi:uncharacterized protein (DUF2384 family)
MAIIRQWRPVEVLDLREESRSLADVHPLLKRVVVALGTNGSARVLDVDAAQVTRWSKGAAISSEMERRIVALHDVLTRALRQFRPRVAAMWLLGSEPLLGGARPIDVLAMEGSSPVLRALEGIEQGAYA